MFSGPYFPQGTTANDVINKYLTAIGGADKIKTIKDLTVSAKGSVQGQDISFKREYKVPGKMLVLVTLPATPFLNCICTGNPRKVK